MAKKNAIKDRNNDLDFNIKLVDCLGADDIELSQGNREQFVPNYNYKAFNADMVENVLKDSKNGAGATLKIQL